MITGSKLQDQFVPYDLAMKLKVLGFKEKCFSGYRNTDGEKSLMRFDVWENGTICDNHEGFCAAPLWQQVIDWLKNEKKILVTELWDGWEVARYNEDFKCVNEKDEAFKYAFKLISK